MLNRFTSASRRSASSASRSATRPRPRAQQARWASTEPTASNTSGASSDVAKYALAGTAGGAAVLLGGYGYYHFSGIKAAVDTARSLKYGVVSAKDKFVQSSPSPNEALNYLREIARSYLKIVPGASGYVDKTFDELDELSKTHGEEVSKVVGQATQEVQEVIKGGKMDLATAQKIYEILQNRGEQLGNIAAEASGGAISKLLDEHPELREKLSGGWGELRQLAEKSGAPEAKKLVEDTTKQVVGLFKGGFSTDTIEKVRKLLKEKTEEARKIADKASKQAYETSLKSAQPILDKFPDVKKLVEDNASLLASSSAGASAASIWDALKNAGDGGKDGSSKLKDLVSAQIEKAKSKGKEAAGDAKNKADGLSEGGLGGAWAFIQNAAPGGKEIPDLSSLAKVAKDNSEEAQTLAKETYDEIIQVLQSKAEKAKKLAEGTKENAKQEASSSSNDDDKKKK